MFTFLLLQPAAALAPPAALFPPAPRTIPPAIHRHSSSSDSRCLKRLGNDVDGINTPDCILARPEAVNSPMPDNAVAVVEDVECGYHGEGGEEGGEVGGAGGKGCVCYLGEMSQ